MPDTRLKPLKLIEDEPVRRLEQDGLGLARYARVIAGTALGTRGPFTIGVYGGWGTGKTTVLGLARSLVDQCGADSNLVTVWFNAWQYENEEYPIVPLVASIVREIEARRRSTATGKIRESAREGLGKLSRALRAIAYGFSAKASGLGIEAGFSAKEMIDRYEQLGLSADPLLERSIYQHAFEALDQVAEEQAGSEDAPKIVVFIDDLDRCLPTQALRLLESIKLVLAQPGFIYVLGVDSRILDAYLDHRFKKEYGLEGYDAGVPYLEKIVQLPLFLPSHRARFGELVSRVLERLAEDDRREFEGLEEALQVAAALNPRSLVRLVNNLLVDLRIREEMEDAPGDDNFLALALVGRVLQQCLGSQQVDRLSEDEKLCQELASGVSLEELRQRALQEKSVHGEERRSVMRRAGLLEALSRRELVEALLQLPAGQDWLADRYGREAVLHFHRTQRPEEPGAEKTQAQLVEAAIRRALDLPEAAVVTDAHRATVTLLSFSNEPLTDAGLAHLQDLPALTDLTLGGTQVTDAGLAHLQGLPALTVLDLSRMRVTDAGLTHLRGLPALTGLDLSGTQVTDAGLAHLRGLTALETLVLRETQVTDAGLAHLQGLAALKTLFLRGTQVTDAGLARLRQELPNTRILGWVRPSESSS